MYICWIGVMLSPEQLSVSKKEKKRSRQKKDIVFRLRQFRELSSLRRPDVRVGALKFFYEGTDPAKELLRILVFGFPELLL